MDQGLALATEQIAEAGATSGATPVSQIVAVLGSGLRFRYQAYHNHVLRVLGILFSRLGPATHPLADQIVLDLAEVCILLHI